MRTTPMLYDHGDRQYTGGRQCARCLRVLRDNQKARVIHIVDGGSSILHPDDEALYKSDGADLGAHLLGMDCARKIGLEWSVPEAGHGR